MLTTLPLHKTQQNSLGRKGSLSQGTSERVIYASAFRSRKHCGEHSIPLWMLRLVQRDRLLGYRK